MRAIYKKVNENPKIVEINDSLLDLQNIVEGDIETLTIDDDLVMIINEEGKIKKLEPNITYNNDVICGNILVLQAIEDKFTGIDFQNIEKVMEKLLGNNSNITMICNGKEHKALYKCKFCNSNNIKYEYIEGNKSIKATCIDCGKYNKFVPLINPNRELNKQKYIEQYYAMNMEALNE